MKKSLFAAILVAGLSLAGCDQKNEAALTQNANRTAAVTSAVVDYGNGVYYFPYVEADFGNALSKFMEEHPNFPQPSIAPDDTMGYGRTKGYFVVFFKTK